MTASSGVTGTAEMAEIPTCPACGAALTEKPLALRCPECGQVFQKEGIDYGPVMDAPPREAEKAAP